MISCLAIGTEHQCPKIGTEMECLIDGHLCSLIDTFDITFYALERVIHFSIGDKIIKRFQVVEHSEDDPMHWKVTPPGPCPGVIFKPPKDENDIEREP